MEEDIAAILWVTNDETKTFGLVEKLRRSLSTHDALVCFLLQYKKVILRHKLKYLAALAKMKKYNCKLKNLLV